MPRRTSALLAALALTLTLAACGGSSKAHDSTPTSVAAAPTTTTTTVPTDTSWVAKARPDLTDVPVYPDAELTSTATQTIKQPNEDGAPVVFLVKGTYDATHPPVAVEVYLPVRPNGSTGFVRTADVTITSHQYRIKVEVGAHHLTVTNAGSTVLDTPVGIGTTDTPTPGGVFYIKELLKVPDPSGPYGPYAYGLSGFSDVLTSFAGGDGVIGIHGTNDPSTIGKDVSHGCIRMSNENITTLAGILPVGTPVEILP